MREKEEKELQLLMEMEEQKRKQREDAAEQVRKLKVSTVSCRDSLHVFIFFARK